MQFLLKKARRVVLKLGTGVLQGTDGQIDKTRIGVLAEQVAELRSRGLDVLIVSSGAVGMGMGRLKLEKRPKHTDTLQACAAIGQTILMQTWQEQFAKYDLTLAQVLLTREDVRARRRHIAVHDTLERLLSLGTIPIINENDTVSAEEIKFGDNDTLSALVGSLMGADILVILSTIPGLMDLKGDGSVVRIVESIDDRIRNMAQGTNSPTAVGGMISKISAAEIATRSGCAVFICSGKDPRILHDLFAGTALGTFFPATEGNMQARKRWIAFFDKAKGCIYVDKGAEEALLEEGSSLLAKGITRLEGSFGEGQVIEIANAEGETFARGLAEFTSEEIQEIAGKSNEEISILYPHHKHAEVIHRDALVLLH
jgi:glutamate 5-kinase